MLEDVIRLFYFVARESLSGGEKFRDRLGWKINFIARIFPFDIKFSLPTPVVRFSMEARQKSVCSACKMIIKHEASCVRQHKKSGASSDVCSYG